MKVFLCGGTLRFRSFLQELFGKDIAFYENMEELPLLKGNENLYFLLPDYEHNAVRIPEQTDELVESLLELKKSGTRFYVENFTAQDYLRKEFTALQMMGGMRSFFQEYIEWNGELLQARDGIFFPAFMGSRSNLTAVLSDCAGVHRIFKEPTRSFPLLKKEKHFFTALMDFSRYNALYRRPYGSWKSFWQALFLELAEIPEEKSSAAFEKVFPDVIAFPEHNTPENAVKKALDWHRILFRDPEGKRGMYEMIRSNDLGLRKNLRPDAELLTGALFASAGALWNRRDLTEIGCNLADALLERNIQRPDGLFWWIDHVKTVYASDNGRDGLALWQLWKTTGKLKYKEAALRLAEGMLRWLAEDGLCSGYFYGDEIPEGWESSSNPVFYAEMTAFLLQLKEERYQRAALRMVENIGKTFPAVSPFGFSDNFTYSRWLLMLAAVHYYTSYDVSGKIVPVLQFFEDLQEPCGGLGETPIRMENHPEAGIAAGDGTDSVADLLYCNNFVLNALSILIRLPAKKQLNLPMEKIRTLYGKLRDFWLRIQIVSSDPRLDGGWMRSFDMETGEYFGLNKDLDWGAYCIMAGWVMGFVPLVLLYEGRQESMFTGEEMFP